MFKFEDEFIKKGKRNNPNTYTIVKITPSGVTQALYTRRKIY